MPGVMGSRRIRRLLAALASTALVAGACVAGTSLPADCASRSVERSATLSDDRLSPQRIDVCKGQTVTIKLDIQEDGELHFHGYDDQVPEMEVHAGEPISLSFDMTRAGQFPIELHQSASEEAEVGILTVYEP
jgi:hypothetical protein